MTRFAHVLWAGSLVGFGLAASVSIAVAEDKAGPERAMAPPSDSKAVARKPGDGSERAMKTQPPAPGDADKDKSKERAMTK